MTLDRVKKYRKTKKGVLTNMYAHMNRRYIDFSLAEFHEMFLEDKKFCRIFNEWERKGYRKDLRPSLDRIDYRIDYHVNNINMMTWAENRYKQNRERKLMRAKPIYQLLDGKIIKKWFSQSVAGRALKVSSGDIWKALNLKTLNQERRKCLGFEWKYVCVALCFLFICSTASAESRQYKAYVESVIDGDSIDVVIDLGFNLQLKERARLLGIDTPELKPRGKDRSAESKEAEKKAGIKAKEFVKNAIENKFITLEVNGFGKFGRPLAVVSFTNKNGETINLNEELIARGLAISYWGGKKPKWE